MDNKNTFGEVSWGDDFGSAGGKQKQAENKDVWLRLSDGENVLRLVTQPHQYLVHKYKKEGDPGFGQKVYCSAIHGSCPVCALGKEESKAKRRWLLGVISRKDNTYKILDISWAVFQQIRKLSTGRWGDPTKYDIDIVVDRKGGPQDYYTVQPIEKSPLSAEDQQLIEKERDLDDLKRKVTPPTPDQAQKRVDKINGVAPADGQKSSTAAASKNTAPSTPAPVDTSNSSDDSEDDEAFPSYAG